MRKQSIPSKDALKVVFLRAFENIQKEYGKNLDDKIFIGFLINEVLEVMTVNVKVSRWEEINELVKALPATR